MRASWLHPFILVAFSVLVLLDIGMNAHLPDNTALWRRSRENPIYGSLIRLSPALPASLPNRKPALGGLEKA
jgi:hypothetical protein